MNERLQRALPYLVVLAAATWLLILTNRLEFNASGGRIGPDFWPRAILVMAMITCAWEIGKTFLVGHKKSDLAGVLGTVVKDNPDWEEPEEPESVRHPRLLLAGIGLTVGYLFAIETLGFFLCTALYLGLFMWIGRYRRVGVIVTTSLVGSLAFVFMFMKVVYVSLPLGTGPFAQVSFLLMRVLGIK